MKVLKLEYSIRVRYLSIHPSIHIGTDLVNISAELVHTYEIIVKIHNVFFMYLNSHCRFFCVSLKFKHL